MFVIREKESKKAYWEFNTYKTFKKVKEILNKKYEVITTKQHLEPLNNG